MVVRRIASPGQLSCRHFAGCSGKPFDRTQQTSTGQHRFHHRRHVILSFPFGIAAIDDIHAIAQIPDERRTHAIPVD